MEIRNMKLRDIIEYENNTKIHTPEQIHHLVNSISNFGFTQPILIDENNVIIAGHGRYLAAIELKMKEVPTILIDYLTEDQKRTYRMVDNNLSLETSFDIDKLIEEIKSIEFQSFDIFGLDINQFKLTDEDLDRNDTKKKKKIVKCPHCGQEFEV